MKSSNSLLDYQQNQDSGVTASELSNSVVFFLFDLKNCKFYYAGGSPNFKGYQSAALLTTECQCLKKIIHSEDVNYLLEVYKNFIRDCRQPGFDCKTHFKWSAEIRILTEAECWNWVEVSFDILSYTDDCTVDKMFCTLKDNINSEDTGGYTNSSSTISSGKFNKTSIRKILGNREIQVLRLIADGNSDKQIAKRLGISAHTSVRHRKNLIEKFNVKNTAELIKEASKVFWL